MFVKVSEKRLTLKTSRGGELKVDRVRGQSRAYE